MNQWDAEGQRWVPGTGSGQPSPGSGQPPPDSDLSRVLIVGVLVLLLLAVAGAAVWMRSRDDGAGGGGTTFTTSSEPPSSATGDADPSTADPYGSGTYDPGTYDPDPYTSDPYDPPAQEEDPPAEGPAETVRSYYGAINSGDYSTAWDLGGKNLSASYSAFESGFAGTQSDTVSVTATDGDTVYVEITADQTDGARHTYTGTYTVRDGTITGARIRRTS
ncbi:hypothetical protein ACFVWY_32700 [Streptomyces sp. NPDC058195]|uniref:hypothetical protein n=1 Tax=Streptomyces sp. NPDC058195 TaxID=3346375 RepID=UPI0036E0EEC0